MGKNSNQKFSTFLKILNKKNIKDRSKKPNYLYQSPQLQIIRILFFQL